MNEIIIPVELRTTTGTTVASVDEIISSNPLAAVYHQSIGTGVITGPQGPAGVAGNDGVGVPIGGTTGQVLAKASDTDLDTEWVEPAAGGGAVSSVNARTGDVIGLAEASDVTTALAGKANTSHTHAESDVTGLVADLAAKEPTITAGTSSQYYRGDKTMQTLTQDVVPDGTTNKAYSATEKTKLAGIATGANVGVVPNGAITGATKTKVTYDTKGLVTAGADATTADIADSTNKRYVTDAQLTVIGNTSGTNTGDNATNTQYSGLAASKQNADQDLTDIAALTPTNDDIMQRKAGAWTNRSMAQVKTDLALVKGDVGLGNVDNTSDSTKNAASATLTNKTISGAANTLSNISADSTIDGTTNHVFTAADDSKLAGIATGATANDTDANLKARANHTGTQTASTISDFNTAADARITAANKKTDSMNTNKLLGRGTASTGVIEEITLGTNLSLTGTTLNAAGGGGGSPGGSTGEVQYNNGGAFAGAANIEVENDNLRLPSISTPSTPAAGGINLFGRSVASRIQPAFIGPNGVPSTLQESLARNRVAWWSAAGNGTVVSTNGFAFTAIGTATAANVATTNLHTWSRRIEYLVTAAATTAIAGYRAAAAQYGTGNAAGRGGFWYVSTFGPATGVATATTRSFTGLRNVITAPTDVEPSTYVNLLGAGWDAADTNIQIMHNDASGTATKIDTGIAVPTVDRTSLYELAMYCAPNGTTIYFEFTDLVNGTVFTANTNTNIPSNTTLLGAQGWCSVGGTSSVIGYAFSSLYISTDL